MVSYTQNTVWCDVTPISSSRTTLSPAVDNSGNTGTITWKVTETSTTSPIMRMNFEDFQQHVGSRLDYDNYDDDDDDDGQAPTFTSFLGWLPKIFQGNEQTTPKPFEDNNPENETQANKVKDCTQVADRHSSTSIAQALNQTTFGDMYDGNSDYICKGSNVGNSTANETKYKSLLMGFEVKECRYYTCDHNQPVCKCDASCILYGDCCYDNLIQLLGEDQNYTAITDKLQNKSELLRAQVPSDLFTSEMIIFEHSECLKEIDHHNAYWMISKCPTKFDDGIIKQRCENGHLFGFNSIPVEWVGTRGRLWTFKNLHCAMCHGLDMDDVRKWEIHVLCEGNFILPVGNTSLSEINDHCDIHTVPPTPALQRPCQIGKDVLTQCQNHSLSSIHISLCESYRYLVGSDELMFRNPHCAFCANGHKNYSTECRKLEVDDSIDKSLDLRILFELNPDRSLTVQASCVAAKECLYFEVYDCYSHKCRRLYCSDHQMPYFGKCVTANYTTQDKYWYESYRPTDLKGLNVSVLYIQVELETLSPIPTSENGLFIRTLFDRYGEIRNEVLKSKETELVSPLFDNAGEQKSDVSERTAGVTTSPHTGIPKELTRLDTGIPTFHNEDDGENSGKTLETNHHFTHNDSVVIDQELDARAKRQDLSQNASTSTFSTVEQFLLESQPRLHNESAAFSGTDNGQAHVNDTRYDERNNTNNAKFHYSYSFELFAYEGNISPDFAMKLVEVATSRDLNSLFDFDLNGHDMKIAVRTYSQIDNLNCDVGNLSVFKNNPYFEALDEVGLGINETENALDKVPAKETLWKVSDTSANTEAVDVVALCVVKQNAPYLNCTMTVYETSEVVVTDDATLHIRNTTLSYKPTEFQIVGQKYFVCVDKITLVTLIRFFKRSKSQRILTITTSSISMVSLAFICISHLALPKLRNNHGLNLLALSITMFLVQAMLLIENTPTGEACVLFAGCLHFLVLKMFIWMSIIGFDLAQTFRKQRVAKRHVNLCRFLKYFCFAFFASVLFVIACLSLDFIKASIRPGYGMENICWLTNSISLILFFIVPVALSIGFNLVVFSITLYSIERAKANSSVKSNKKQRSYCFAYIKMSLILGFTWSVGIISAFFSFDWLWYIHMTLNGLQGLGLFCCTMVNSRTIKIFKESTRTLTSSGARTKFINATAKEKDKYAMSERFKESY